MGWPSDAIGFLVMQGVQVTVIVQGMAYSMGPVVLQAASPGRLPFPHSWIMITSPQSGPAGNRRPRPSTSTA